MGVPKFYRWISERYPCLSEVVTEFQIPDFDNLYLDMNGIIHTCSHPNDDDPHFRITEEKIFVNICHYIEFLFKMIKPKKVFFMAVDGVAPRAKMNQQRGRRFRTAKAAVVLEEQALSSGEALPSEARFDSNCITPGTLFMARLHNVLKDFVVYKISTDKLWQNVRVYLSGHETPGEGEHKIMDFIRYEKSQSGYNPNTRHCLYGLDADLIMLGICSHEPHFCLLREEVKFGGKRNQKRIATPEETTFHLLHISLLRDYLYHEFSPVKCELSFPYDVEKVVDDFVLMSFLVGNDFIPHLPQLHIHHDALPVLFQTYMVVLPMLGGYINEEGYLNLERFQIFLEGLACYDFQKFGELNDDFQYLERKSKSKKDSNSNEKTSTSDLLSELGFSNLAIEKTAELDSSFEDEDSEDECSTLELEFNMHKVDYYMNKLEIEQVTPDVLKDQAEGYVRAIQWNLHYYYNGVVSWSWYYPHHYSPYISDVQNFKDMEMKFELGKPFLPFQQLLAVLPKLSKDLLPIPYQKLMCEKDSKLIDFYPDDFLTDLNGKQQEWEAIVLIPFINENLLVHCASIADKELTEEEKQRNSHGPHLLYTYNEKLSAGPLSFLPGYYSPINKIYAELQKIDLDFFRLPPEKIFKGLCKGVILDRFMLGFPTLRTLKHSATLKNEKVKVFHMTSMKDNMMVTIEEIVENDLYKLSKQLIGKSVYVGYPHLHEALVVAISNGQLKYFFEKDCNSDTINIVSTELTKDEQKIWVRQVESVQENFYQRWGIFTGKIKVLVFVKCFSGLKYNISNDGKICEKKKFDGSLANYAAQTIVWNIQPFCPDIKNKTKNIEDIYPVGSVVFLLTPQYYGSMGKILENDIIKNKGNVSVNAEVIGEPDLMPVIHNQGELMGEQFMPGYIAAQQLGIESHFFSCVTGTIMIQTSPKGSSNPNRANIGLNLKFNKKNEEVQGFSRKKDNQWLYSEEAVRTLNNYLSKFADFFEKLYRYMDKDVIYIEDLYPNGEGPEVISKIMTWLKEQTCSLAERQQCGMNKLDIGIVNAIEKIVENSHKESHYVKKSIKPSQLYNPLLSKGIFIPEQRITFNLFDRVVNIRPSSSVPLGLKGTVIGIQKAEKDSDYMYEILFDKEFPGGIAVSSGTRKGYRMPPNAVINLSHGFRLHKQNANSPAKTSRVVMPRLNRTALFDTAVKQLHPQNSAPVQILQKTNNSSPLQTKPFYKADSNDFFPSWNKNSQLMSQNLTFYNSGHKQFVTPNANRLSGGSNTSPNISAKNDISNTHQSDFQNFWSNLKKRVPDTHFVIPSQEKIPVSQSNFEQTYGQKVSIEELFQGAQNHIEEHQKLDIQKKNIVTSSPVIQQSRPRPEAPDILRQLCLEVYKQLPIYSYHNHGLTNLITATVKLPNGEHVSSIPSTTKLDAAGNAAEKGLAVLNAFMHSAPPEPSFVMRNPPPNYQVQQKPFLLPTPPPNFMHPQNFPPPVFPTFNNQNFDGSLMRHPPPIHAPHIPDSFVKSNQRLLLTSNMTYSVQQNSFSTPSPEINKASGDIFHIPGGGTAIIRNTPTAQKGCDSSFSNMFVPAQVMKQAIRTDGVLSNFEWPDLPEKVISKPVISTLLPESNNSPEGQTKSFSDVSKCLLGNPTAENDKSSPHPTNMTVLKKTKPRSRLAANFQNL